MSKSFILLPLAPLALDYNLYIYHCGGLSGQSNGWSFWILAVELFGTLRRDKRGRPDTYVNGRLGGSNMMEGIDISGRIVGDKSRFFPVMSDGIARKVESRVRNCRDELLTRVRLSSALGRLSRFYGFSSSWYALSFNSVSRTEQFS